MLSFGSSIVYVIHNNMCIMFKYHRIANSNRWIQLLIMICKGTPFLNVASAALWCGKVELQVKELKSVEYIVR